MKEKETELKTSIIKVILKAAQPITYRIESLVKDYYNNNFHIARGELAILMEFHTAGITLSAILQEYIDQALEHDVNSVFLPATEFRLILQLSKTIEIAQRTTIGNAPLWAN